MPTKFTIPEHRGTQCAPCEFHKCFNAFYGSDHSWRDYNCMHPEAFDDIQEPLSSDPKIAAKQGALRAALLEHGRHIGKTEEQPAWCPLRRKANLA